MKLRALSLRQPWAFLVVHRSKSIENRRWQTPFRGDFLIHAAKGCTRQEHADALAFAEGAAPGCTTGMPAWKETERGGIVGIARLVAVIAPRLEMIRGTLDHYPPGVNWRWHMIQTQFGFVLENVRPVPFIPCRGMLGFFDVPDEVMAQVQYLGNGGAPVQTEASSG